MKILALYGCGKMGKSKTINSVVDFLRNNNAKIVCERCVDNKSVDRCYIIEYKEKIIGITTRGDDERSLKKDFEWIQQHRKIDFVICAARTKGNTCHFIKKQARKDGLFWLAKNAFYNSEINDKLCKKAIEEQQNILNLQQAADIVCIIDKFLCKEGEKK